MENARVNYCCTDKKARMFNLWQTEFVKDIPVLYVLVATSILYKPAVKYLIKIIIITNDNIPNKLIDIKIVKIYNT